MCLREMFAICMQIIDTFDLIDFFSKDKLKKMIDYQALVAYRKALSEVSTSRWESLGEAGCQRTWRTSSDVEDSAVRHLQRDTTA